MSDTTWNAGFSRARPETASAPQPRPGKGGPVLIGDITASRGDRPLLLDLWRKWEEDAAQARGQ